MLQRGFHVNTTATPDATARNIESQNAVGSQPGQEFSALTRRYSRKVLACAQYEMRETGLAPIESNFDHIRRKMILAATPDIMKIANRATWIDEAGSMVGKSYHAKIVSPSSATPTVSVAMSSPTGFREFNEYEYRKFIRTLSDEELIKAGKRLRILCGDVVTPTPSTFDQQFKICREEIRRRHPRLLFC